MKKIFVILPILFYGTLVKGQKKTFLSLSIGSLLHVALPNDLDPEIATNNSYSFGLGVGYNFTNKVGLGIDFMGSYFNNPV